MENGAGFSNSVKNRAQHGSSNISSPLESSRNRENGREHSFFTGVFPSCMGLNEKNWNYSLDSEFLVHLKSEEEYYLHIYQEEGNRTVRLE